MGAVLGGLLFVIAFVVEGFTRAPETISAGISYLGIFIFGILVARSRNELSAWLKQMSRLRLQIFLWSSVILFLYAHSVAVVLRAGMKGTDLITAIAGAGLIVYSLSVKRASAALTSPLPLFLGRISYSLYLLHGTVLFTLAYVTYGRLPQAVILAPYLLITIGFATAMYEAVEVPSINLGHRIAARLERKRPGVAVTK
jgi:peptidoglycan/LPS O-acetylase OafA/YrhL